MLKDISIALEKFVKLVVHTLIIAVILFIGTEIFLRATEFMYKNDIIINFDWLKSLYEFIKSIVSS